MPDGSDAVTVQVHPSVHAVEPADWDACAGTENPFVCHAFLAALEDSGAVSARTGWRPCHLTVETGAGRVLACAPLYLKSHSYGEYVFDWGWADAYERAGGRYYPKLQCSVPFTTVTGPRLLLRPGASAGMAEVLAGAMLRLTKELDASSVHVTFPMQSELATLAGLGFLPRIGCQYHWHNRGYGSFEDFLSDLSARKRKAIRKERAGVVDQGIRVQMLTGEAIEEHHWETFHRFYLDTVGRKWAHAYLNRAFFLELGRRLAHRVLLVWAETADGIPVGVALNLIGTDALYGRYWGGSPDVRFAHFEVCYYRAIDYAIAHNLSRVEAGAQGEHKIQRGYVPVPTRSAHWIADPRLRTAIEAFLGNERPVVEGEIAALSALTPFRADAGT